MLHSSKPTNQKGFNGFCPGFIVLKSFQFSKANFYLCTVAFENSYFYGIQSED